VTFLLTLGSGKREVEKTRRVQRVSQSGRRDLNSGPLVPQTSALTRLRHAPSGGTLAHRLVSNTRRAALRRAPMEPSDEMRFRTQTRSPDLYQGHREPIPSSRSPRRLFRWVAKTGFTRPEEVRNTHPPMSGAAPDHAVRILLTDNTHHRLFAKALHTKLENDPRFEVVGIASDGEEAVHLVGEVGPDIVLLDREQDEGTLSATRLISSRKRAPRVVVLAGPDDEFGAVEAHDAGAAAFLRKPRSAADLLETLELATLLIQAAVPSDDPQND
jgi:CheY-like chemotaxis protein